jgi:Ca-activated chloride channel family protein
VILVHPWLLLPIIAPVFWVAYGWRDTARRLPLLLKAASFCAALIAFAEPMLTLPRTKVGAVVLVDTSASVTPADLQRASSLVAAMERERGGNWVKVVPFAGQTRLLAGDELAHGIHLKSAASPLGDSTNLEAALESSMSAVPANYIPRLVLISDGNENEGSSARAIAQMRRLQVPVDTIALEGRPSTDLRLDSLSIPRIAYAGEQIPIDLAIRSPGNARASVEVSVEGRMLGANTVRLEGGMNTLRVHARLKTSGATSVSGRIRTDEYGELPFEQAIEMRRAKVLYLSQDPAGSDLNLLRVFEQGAFEVTRDAGFIDRDLNAIQLVVLNNLDLNALSPARKNRLEAYVRDGGGLLLIGGERQVYKEEKRMDALDRALPAKLAPPKSPEGTSVVLIIDKSSSMEGRKIELARLSAIGVVDHLRPIDNIGVLIFDNSFQWAVPMRRAEDKSLIKRLISGITPDGGTQIAPALTEGYRKVLPSKGTFKHIVLLTDGISEEGDSIELAKRAAENQVTISTVGLGQDVNRAYLEKVAATADGRSYFLNEPQGLEQILLKDVKDYTGGTAVERPLAPIVERKAEVLDGVGMEQAPPLKGYARFAAKEGADTILGIDSARRDPLYVRWQYGLGRSAVFASDAKSRWAADWLNWPGFDKFWTNVARDLLTHADPSEATAELDAANGDIAVTYRISEETPDPGNAPAIFVLGPEKFEKAISVKRIAARLYRGSLHIGSLRGLFRIRPVNESHAFPEVGLYRQQEEQQDYGSNNALLAQIANLTGGRFNPPIESLFEARGRSVSGVWQLWPTLLGLAIALNVAELVARKWGGLLANFRGAS